MAFTIASLLVKLGLDASALQKGLDTAEQRTGTFSKNLGSIGDKVSSTGKTMFAALTLPLVGAGAGMIKLASDLEESANAVNVVFGESADILHEYGKTASQTAGLATSEFNQMSAQTGAFLKNVGFNVQGAANETIKLTERASDMASIFNTDVNQALAAIQSGLKGEFNPLEAFGVKLNAAKIENQALAMGLATTKAELDDTAKAQAALALIYEQTDQFAGDFRNTSDGLANSMKILKSDLANTAAELGQMLLPYVLQAVTFVKDLVVQFQSLSPEQQKMILMIGGIVAAAGPLLIIVGSIISAIGAIIPVVTAVAGVLTFPLIAIIAAVIAIGALLVAAWKNNWGGIQEKTKVAVEFIKNTVTGFLNKIKDFWEQHGTRIKTIALAIWLEVQAVFQQFINVVRPLFQAFKAAFEGDWYTFGQKLREVWDNAWKLVQLVLSLAWGNIKNMVRELINNIINYFKNTDWRKVGQDVLKGIVNGLSSLKQWAIDTIVNIARAMTEAFKGFFGIHSESKLMYDIGRNMARGTMSGFASNVQINPAPVLATATANITAPAGAAPAATGIEDALLLVLRNLPEDLSRANLSAFQKVKRG